MIIYRTDEYGNQISKKCQQDRAGKYVYNDRKWSPEPAPEVAADEIAVCLEGKWEVKKKNLGTWYEKISGRKLEMTEYNPNFNPDKFTLLVPCEYPKWDGAKWIIDTETKTAAEEAQKLAELADIDRQSIRPLRAVLAAIQKGTQPDPADISKLDELESAAKAKRSK